MSDKPNNNVVPLRRLEQADFCPYETDPRTDPDFLAEADKCARELERDLSTAFDRLTVALVLEQHRRGELDEAVLEAMMQGIGLEVAR